eukprot:1161628-Pelagomonas_calceolata.AAC.17
MGQLQQQRGCVYIFALRLTHAQRHRLAQALQHLHHCDGGWMELDATDDGPSALHCSTDQNTQELHCISAQMQTHTALDPAPM